LPDGSISSPADGSTLTFNLSTPITDHGDAGYDFVYYENPAGSGILMDQVIIQVSQDGSSWTTVFNWGDNAADTNSNLNMGGAEADNTDISSGLLINGTGVGIDVSPWPGSYSYLRIIAPSNGGGDGIDIDAIEIY
jgi:hypothetical protein